MTKEDAAIAFQALALTAEGATVLNYLVGKFGYARRTTLSTDPHLTAFNEGQRSVLVDIGILLDLTITPKGTVNDGSSSYPGYDFDPNSGPLDYPDSDNFDAGILGK